MWETASDRHDAGRGLVDGSNFGEEDGWTQRMQDEAQDRVNASGGRLTAIQVREGNGCFLLTASLSEEEQAQLMVDLRPGALCIQSGRVTRWVPLPHDVLLHHAAVRVGEGTLTVSIPVEARTRIRHVVHVW